MLAVMRCCSGLVCNGRTQVCCVTQHTRIATLQVFLCCQGLVDSDTVAMLLRVAKLGNRMTVAAAKYEQRCNNCALFHISWQGVTIVAVDINLLTLLFGFLLCLLLLLLQLLHHCQAVGCCSCCRCCAPTGRACCQCCSCLLLELLLQLCVCQLQLLHLMKQPC